jgi:bleomycin hydrolase
LAVNFGEPPVEFKWRFEKSDAKLTDYKTYTPRSFFKETIGVALDDYLCLCSVPTRGFNRMYEIDLDKSVDEKPGLVFLNMPLDTLKNLAKRCILDKTPVWFACDVKQEVASKQGLMINELHDYESLYGMPFELTRKDLFETYIETPNHAMVLTGLDLTDGKVQKWLVENSWGKTYGNDGFFSMRDDWFDFYVQMVVVKKQYVTDSTLKLFDQKPELLPPWDPFYRAVTVVSVEE